jgi:hypothetical protein
LRIKEQETRLTLHEHDGGGDDDKYKEKDLFHVCIDKDNGKIIISEEQVQVIKQLILFRLKEICYYLGVL